MSSYYQRRKAWAARVADFLASGLTGVEWCERNELPVYSLRYWLSKHRSQAEGAPSGSSAKRKTTAITEWTPVEIIEDVDTVAYSPELVDSSSGCVTLYLGAARIEVRSGVDSALLSEVLKAVVATC